MVHGASFPRPERVLRAAPGRSRRPARNSRHRPAHPL